ncbi:MAG: insulinase family protein [Holosporaceae bacterium]|jgi:predicted Zn-dependent peptidase|nr:insulinase family protein [Holosporaceae bacterium]
MKKWDAVDNIKLTKLNNGVRVVTKKLENFDSVVIGYWVEAGVICEEESNNGISHFLEHMAFKGTSKRTAKQIAEEIESVGGYLNAYTSKEVTAFHAKVLKEDIQVAIEILSDVLQDPAFLIEEVEMERSVILQEIYQTYDTPDDIIFDYFEKVAFAKQALGRPILGPIEVVSKISADNLRRYRNEYYNADNIIFAAVGNVSHDELINSAEKYLCNFSRKKTLICDATYDYIGGAYSDTRDLEQAHLIIGFNGLSNSDSDYYTLALFSSILGGGMSSRLFQEVREKRGLVYSIYSFSSSYRRNGTFGVYAATSPDKLSELSKIVSEELMKMRKEISEKELKRTKAQFKANLLMMKENNSASCEQIVNQTLIFKHPIGHEKILEKLNAITMEDIQLFTERLLASNSSVVTVGKCDCSPVIRALQNSGVKIP